MVQFKSHQDLRVPWFDKDDLWQKNPKAEAKMAAKGFGNKPRAPSELFSWADRGFANRVCPEMMKLRSDLRRDKANHVPAEDELFSDDRILVS
jgi:hypothetical protein